MEGGRVARLASDIADQEPGAVRVTDRVPGPSVVAGRDDNVQIAANQRGRNRPDDSRVPRLTGDVSEREPGAIRLADRVPWRTIRRRSQHVKVTSGAVAGDADILDGSWVARLTSDIAEQEPGAVRLADRLPCRPCLGGLHDLTAAPASPR